MFQTGAKIYLSEQIFGVRCTLRAFVYGLIDNDERVASSKSHTQFKTRAGKPYTIQDQNDQINT